MSLIVRGIADSSCGSASRIRSTVDDIRAGLAEHDHQHRRLPVHVARLAKVFHRVDSLAHIADAHRDAVSIGNHQRLIVRRFQDLIVGADLPKPRAVREVALGYIGIGARQRAPHGFERDAVLVEHDRVQFHPHTGQRASAHHYLAHALKLR